MTISDNGGDGTQGTEGPRGLRWTPGLLAVVVLISTAAGSAAALVGGSLTDWGEGVGGLYGVPWILATLIALVVAPIAVVAIVRSDRDGRPWWVVAVVVVGGAWVVSLGYVVVPHAIDPCYNGWWDFRSRIGNQRLCEFVGSDLNVHTRFHLLLHGAPTILLLGAYVWAVNRWARSKGHARRREATTTTTVS